MQLENEEYDTFNGLVFHALGSVPEKDMDIRLQIKGMDVTVTEIDNHHIVAAIIKLQSDAKKNLLLKKTSKINI